jgi:carotenoid cleavage dioxygenase-like enzyme
MASNDNNGKNGFLEALLAIPAMYHPRISRNSRFVAYTWKNVHPNLNVFLVPTDGKSRPVALTETHEATFIVDFALDSNSVIVGEDKNRNERVRLLEVVIDKPE